MFLGKHYIPDFLCEISVRQMCGHPYIRLISSSDFSCRMLKSQFKTIGQYCVYTKLLDGNHKTGEMSTGVIKKNAHDKKIFT